MKPHWESTRITLQTRLGTEIDNEQNHVISQSQLNQCAKAAEEHKSVVFRSEPTGIYNCHGIVFASRRTCILSEQDVQTILKEDNYAEVPSEKDVLPGDVAIYYDETGEITHTGIVLEPPSDENLKVPLILSKWGRYKEAIHLLRQCPRQYGPAKVRYYRIMK